MPSRELIAEVRGYRNEVKSLVGAKSLTPPSSSSPFSESLALAGKSSRKRTTSSGRDRSQEDMGGSDVRDDDSIATDFFYVRRGEVDLETW